MRIYSNNTISPARKIEEAIELLTYYNLTSIEISYQLNYDSVEEFTNQFKMVVGLSPERYKQLSIKRHHQYQDK